MVHCGYVESDWGQVHYRRSGKSGPWVVMFHESPLSSLVFEGVLVALGSSVRAIAFDTPGYGASAPPPNDGVEIPEYAQVLARAIEALDVTNPILGGVHTGASLAIATAHALTAGCGGLVLSGVPLFTEQERADYLADWTPPIPFDVEGNQFAWAVERYRRIWPDLTAKMLHLAVVELLRSGPRYDWAYRAAFRYDPSEQLRRADAPILLLDAEFDLLAEKDEVALTIRSDAELVVLPGLAGQPHLRDPEQYAGALLDFLTRTSSMTKPDPDNRRDKEPSEPC